MLRIDEAEFYSAQSLAEIGREIGRKIPDGMREFLAGEHLMNVNLTDRFNLVDEISGKTATMIAITPVERAYILHCLKAHRPTLEERIINIRKTDRNVLLEGFNSVRELVKANADLTRENKELKDGTRAKNSNRRKRKATVSQAKRRTTRRS